MKVKITYLIGMVILILVFVDCQDQNNLNSSLIYFDIKDKNKTTIVKLSEFGVKNVQYIPLKTDTNYLISHITKLVATDNTFVVFSNGKFFQFDFNGSFINQIGKIGRGPQEYQFSFDFAVDNKNEQVFIPIMNKSKLMIYSLNGEFVKSIPCPMYTRNICHIQEGLLCRCDYIGGKYEGENSIFLIDYKGDTVKKFSDKYNYTNTHKMSNNFREEFLMCKYNKKLFIKEIYSDTVFVFENLEFKPAFVLDHGGKTLSVKAREKINNFDSFIEIATQYCRETNLFLFRNHVFSEFTFQNKYYNFIGSFKGESLLIDAEFGIINDIDGGPNVIFQTNKGKNTIISWISAMKFKEHVASKAFKTSTPKYPEKKKELEQLANSLNENDNPVLMLINLRE